MTGKQILHYKILEELGRGGMGVVYKAEDTRLGRTVALKFLSPHLTQDAAAKARFIQEAQAASALEHPNLCTIYSIDEAADGQTFICMAYYEGETLKEKIAASGNGSSSGSRIGVADAVDIATQIAAGLARAHEAGIVHRDIKPANILVTDRGEAKILDFGIAKLAGQAQVTRTGATLGTVAYMSPEQLQGEIVDHRTDIWSLGVVLYEMLTGQVPFRGEIEQATMFAIVSDDPAAVASLNPEVPAAIGQIVSKCLEKEPGDRYDTIVAVVSDLRARRPGVAFSRVPEHVRPADTPPRWRISRKSATRAAIVLSVVATLFLVLPSFDLPLFRTERPARLGRQLQITSAMGVEDFPTWSPDGSRLAYASNQDGDWDIYIVQANGGRALNLTDDFPGHDRHPMWSPDGSQIAFWSRRDSAGIFVMPALGGPARRITQCGYVSSPQWSKDGESLAMLRMLQGEYAIEAYDLRGNKLRHWLVAEGIQTPTDLRWSPDNRFFVFAEATDTPDISHLWLLRTEDGAAFQLTDGSTDNRSPSWSADGRALYFLSNRLGASDLFVLELNHDGHPSSSPRQISSGIVSRSVAISPKGEKMAYSRGRLVGNLWRAPILPDRAATWLDAEQITFDEAFAEAVDISPDGKTIVFCSDRGGNIDLWLMPVDGSEKKQLTVDAGPDFNPSFSPDGTTIVFHAVRTGNREIYTTPRSGGRVSQLTNHGAHDMAPTWSPDGEMIAFMSTRSDNQDIWLVAAQGGEVVQFTTHPADDHFPLWSPNGEWLYFASRRGASARRLWRKPTSGGEAELVSPHYVSRTRFSRDGESIFFISPGIGSKIWVMPSEGGEKRVLIDLAGEPGRLSASALATDGQFVYFSWKQDFGDLWVAELTSNE